VLKKKLPDSEAWSASAMDSVVVMASDKKSRDACCPEQVPLRLFHGG
jgi:hypothetical protein